MARRPERCGGAAAASGFVKAGFGFHMLANFSTLVAAALVAAAVLAHRRGRARPARLLVAE